MYKISCRYYSNKHVYLYLKYTYVLIEALPTTIMVLTTIISETIDLGYHIVRLTASGVKYSYNWYYGIEEQTLEQKTQQQNEETNKALHDIKDMIIHLQEKIEVLENAKTIVK